MCKFFFFSYFSFYSVQFLPFSYLFFYFYLPLCSFPNSCLPVLVPFHCTIPFLSEPETWTIIPLSTPLPEQALKIPKREGIAKVQICDTSICVISTKSFSLTCNVYICSKTENSSSFPLLKKPCIITLEKSKRYFSGHISLLHCYNFHLKLLALSHHCHVQTFSADTYGKTESRKGSCVFGLTGRAHFTYQRYFSCLRKSYFIVFF